MNSNQPTLEAPAVREEHVQFAFTLQQGLASGSASGSDHKLSAGKDVNPQKRLKVNKADAAHSEVDE